MTSKYSSQIRLVVSIILSFVVMLFINGFIGSMGGTPAFIAYTLTFYRLRTRASGDGAESAALTGRLFLDYAFCYIVLWTVFRAALFFSRVTGWGNIRGLSALEYINELINTSMLEKWIGILAALIMFAFILSLFPLVVIKGRAHWAGCALVDGAIFALIASAIDALALRGADRSTKEKATCLVDALLIGGEIEEWQAILVFIAMMLFVFMTGALALFYAKKVLANRGKEKRAKSIKAGYIAAASAGIAAVVVVTVIILLMPADSTGDYRKVAEYMTNDKTLGPVSYRGSVYVPDDVDLNLIETGTPQGYLAEKGETCESRLYRLVNANLLYSDTTGLTPRLKAESQNAATLVPVARLEQSDEWQEDTAFLIWDEDWEAESAYTHEPTGYTVCTRDFIEALLTQFPEVDYQISDFYDYDAYFTIRAYEDIALVTSEQAGAGDWVGCILAKGDKFYFGSYNNQITGICLQELREVLGGN